MVPPFLPADGSARWLATLLIATGLVAWVAVGFDVADIRIDNCAPHGDASVEVKDNEKICPLSGLAATYCLWAVQAEAVERLQAAGVNPTIFRSVHVGGPEHVEQQRKAFLEQGV